MEPWPPPPPPAVGDLALRLLDLAEDLLLAVCKTLQLVDLCRLARCNKVVRALASNGSLWTNISFPPSGAEKLTDGMLAKLLERVQAKQHTETVSLAGCTRIDGSGLEPLRGSTVLRTVDLRRAVFRKGLVKATPFDASAFATLESLAASVESLRVLKEDRYPGRLRDDARLRECAMCVEVSEAGAEAAFFRGCIDCERTFCYRCVVYDTSWTEPAYMCVECNGGEESGEEN
ncbi:hypothetical protein EMIHUDRAFT_246343 [Emiliania huxleyi CCMP1516]|uniref:F-box domain-containing protein n=2 Tax=Emiliania huxleyi TaxID=2903 RepID=A0A0D3ISJ3_EMIH1|nr:hypothetical protein EMIHUDRAFT_246343 [Emiliania huxleyi CCMP1516]EOD14228.1 hypothetical protein EMIHUDRAFT_246343 [Emiliania huxleyi CCMP1516]|eukprot:XP_005766657.1 hypothetical protein EMIHUDRAFT_246343 [Emiliania huxleyi CCMP1516]